MAQKITRNVTRAQEVKYVGDIPKAGTTIEWVTPVFNIFNHHYGYADSKEWWLEYLESTKNPNLSRVKSLSDNQIPTTIGWISKLKLLNCTLPTDTEEWFDRQQSKLFELAMAVKAAKQEAKEDKPKVKNEHIPILATIEDEIDSFIESGCKSNTKFKDLYALYTVPVGQLKLISERYSPLLSELESVNKDKDLKEAYSYLSRVEVRRFADFVRGIIDAATTGLDNAKKQRKPRAKKKPSVEKLLKGLKFLPHCKELNLSSVAPEKLIGASVVWVYNTKTRQLFYLTAKDGEKLTVKGTTVLGFDPAKSFSKKVRKPELDVPKISSAAKKTAYKLFDSLTTKPAQQDVGRISAECLLLRIE
ncbi:hypothetical protein phiOC_p096 [Ochrobactrum phage vB_OspM_OC]|nr:hypothetical protein phiOC_p096 [Ochrobactrum phage vB_OspM_OC]